MQTSNLNGDADTDILRSLQDYSDVASWINDVLEEDGSNGDGEGEGAEHDHDHDHDLTELEHRVSHLSAILEVACEDTSAQLEKTIDDVSRTVPRLTYDLALMQESALSLQKALQGVERHSAAFLNTNSNANTSATAKEEEEEGKAKSEIGPILEQLYFLDTVKRNMEASLAVLREAEAWSSLESEVVSYLSEQAYSKAAARLSEASKSLGVFQNTPEYETRKTLMINLQNQLEAALSSALVAGINNNDVDACKRFFDIFCHIEREVEFRSYWNGSKRKGIVALWQETKLRDCSDDNDDVNLSMNPEGKKFSTFLPEFYHEILSILQIERLSAVLIFPDPQPSLSTFITSTLSSLHPSVSQRLNALVTFHGDLVLPELISSLKATEEFAVATDKIMEKVGYSSFSPAVVPANLEDRESTSASSRPHARRRSTRQSFSRRLNRSSISGPPMPIGAGYSAGTGSGPPSLDHSWEEALFEPFLDYQCDYATLEKRILRAQLKDLLVLSASTTMTTTGGGGGRLLRERAIDVLSFADEALTRCMAFTHGYGIVGLIQALDDLFETFLHSARQEILESGSGSGSNTDSGGDGGGGTFDFDSESGQEFAELDYSPSDLATFQLALHLLESARGVLERLVAFETKLRASVLTTSSALRMARNDPFGSYVSGTTRTALGLLQASALNSLELQSLLDAVDPEQSSQLQQQQQQQHQQQQQVALPHSAFAPSSGTFAGAQKTAGAGPATRSAAAAILLHGARNAVSEFAKACQMRLQETLLAPLFKHLSSYASLPAWTTSDPRERTGSTTATGSSGGGSGSGGGGGAVNEVIIPTFSLSPNNTIQRVAEGLLSLPRLFEVYADDDALAFSIETLPYVDAEKLFAMSTEAASVAESEANAAAVTAATTNNDGSSRPKARHYPSSTSSLSVQISSSSSQHPSSSTTAQPTLILTPETVSSAWLTSLTLTLFSHLTSRILPSLPRLTSAGTAQLSEDLSYLAQIGRALGVEWVKLEAWREGVSAGEEEVRRKVGELSSSLSAAANIDDGGEGEKESEEVLEVWKSAAKLRGIAI